MMLLRLSDLVRYFGVEMSVLTDVRLVSGIRWTGLQDFIDPGTPRTGDDMDATGLGSWLRSPGASN